MNLPILALISMGALFVQSPATTTTIRKADDTAQTTWTYQFDNIDYRDHPLYDVAIPVDGTFTISYFIQCSSTPAWNSSGQGMQIFKNGSEFLQLIPLVNSTINYSPAITLVDGATFVHTDILNFAFLASYIPDYSTLKITLYLGGYYDGYADGFNAGNAGAEGQFEAGYNQGYNAGINESATKVNGLDWIKLALSQVNEILQIEILPGIRLSYLVAIPLIFSLLYFILGWFK